MTAHAFKEEWKCIEAGMDAYVSKPIDFKTCLQLIKDSLDKSGYVPRPKPGGVKCKTRP